MSAPGDDLPRALAAAPRLDARLLTPLHRLAAPGLDNGTTEDRFRAILRRLT